MRDLGPYQATVPISLKARRRAHGRLLLNIIFPHQFVAGLTLDVAQGETVLIEAPQMSDKHSVGLFVVGARALTIKGLTQSLPLLLSLCQLE